MPRNHSQRKEKSCLDSSPVFYISFHESIIPKSPLPRTTLISTLCSSPPYRRDWKDQDWVYFQSPSTKAGFGFFGFLGTETMLQELTTKDSGVCQVLSGSTFRAKLKDRWEVPWSISGKRSTRPPPRLVTSCSLPPSAAALPASPPSSELQPLPASRCAGASFHRDE